MMTTKTPRQEPFMVLTSPDGRSAAVVKRSTGETRSALTLTLAQAKQLCAEMNERASKEEQA